MSASALASASPRRKFRPVFLLFLAAMHVCAATALWHFEWGAFIVAFSLFALTGCLGVSICLHRMLAHDAFKAKPWFEKILAVIATLAFQSGPISWVGTHKAHHAFSDTERDPHDSTRGFWWSHLFWMFFDCHEPNKRLAPGRMRKSLFYRFLERGHLLLTAALGAVLYLLGGWPYLAWGVFFRIVLLLHLTWAINSVAHLWGRRDHPTGDSSRNVRWLAPLTFGEGLHNNHHADERSAKFSRRRWEIDVSWPVIRLFEKLGWIHDVVRPKTERITSAA